MYKVIRFFTDLQDNKYAYNVGDVYPRDGLTVTEKRIKELASNKNRQKRPLIEKVVEETATTEVVNDESVDEHETTTTKKKSTKKTEE